MRLFVALRPPPSIRAILCDIAGPVPAARWQDDAQLHCTVRFLGDVDRPQAEDVAAALASLYAPAPQVCINGVGRFAHKGRTDTLWAGLAPTEALRHLARKVDQACVRAGLPPDPRAYHPHITVARLPRSAGAGPEIDAWLATHAGLSSDDFVLSHLMLYESHLGRGGATYEAVACWPLASVAEPPHLLSGS